MFCWSGPDPSVRGRTLRRGLASVACAFLTLAGALLPRAAHAQSGAFYLDRAQISGAPDDGFMVWRPYMNEKTRFYGSVTLGYTHRPLRADVVTDNPVVQNNIEDPVKGQFMTYLGVGTEITDRVGFNIMFPITILQITGADPQGQGVGGGGLGDANIALNDLRLDMRVRTWETDNHLLRIGGGGAFFIPTGNQTALTSDGAVSTYLYGSAEFDFGKFLLAGNIGPHIRPELSIGGPNGALFIASELRWAGGLYLPMRDGKVRLGGELWGSTGIEKSDNHPTFFRGHNTDLEWLAQIRYVLDDENKFYTQGGFGTRLTNGYGSPDFRMLIGIGTYWTLVDFEPKSPPKKIHIVPDVNDYDRDSDGDGIPDAIDKCPTIKEDGKPPAPSDGCPADSDRDGDGIPDSKDECPDVPGIKARNGCPDVDTDNDGIPDSQDKCPTQPGPRSDVAEKNGCPTLIKEEGGQVTLLQNIQFETGKAVIKPESYPILDEVVILMKARKDMKIGVYGHTDSRGGVAMNIQLSKGRAAAVMKYLVEHGINSTRLQSDGFGPNKPIADNNTDEGRAKNRRVEFKILSGGD